MKIFLLLICVWLVTLSYGQTPVNITNGGVEITIKTGTTIYNVGTYKVTGGALNEIASDGTVEFKDSIVNNSSTKQVFYPGQSGNPLPKGSAILNSTTDQIITGTNAVSFNDLIVNKSAGNISLQKAISADTINLTAGNINLYGKTITLRDSGLLLNETNAKRIYGDSGYVTFPTIPILNAGYANTNIKGSGLEVNLSGVSMGSTVIQRGHKIQSTADSSIRRYYLIKPTTSQSANVKLRYLDNNEIIGNESLYKLWQSTDSGSTWLNVGGTVDAANNFVSTSTLFSITNNNKNILTVADPNCNTVPNTNITVGGVAKDTVLRCVGASVTLDAGSFPTHTYSWTRNGVSYGTTQTVNITTNGNYVVTVTSISGCFKKDSVNATFEVLPVPNFTPVHQCQGTLFSLTNTSTYAVGSTFTWNYGDAGATGNTTNGSYTYANEGKYAVTLKITSPWGCNANKTDTVKVYSIPNANFTFTNQCLNTAIPFTSTTTIDPVAGVSQAIMTYSWDFDSNGTNDGSGATVNHTYGTADSAIVTLTTITNYTCMDTVKKMVITYPKPNPNYTYTADTCENALINFVNTSTVEYGTLSYQWYLQAGVTPTTTNASTSYSTFYDSYTTKLIATSNNGCKDSISKPVRIRPNPVVVFTRLPRGCVGYDINLNNTSYIPEGTQTYLWSFADTTTSTLTNPSKSFAYDGIKKILLTATSDRGCITKDSTYMQIGKNPVFDFTLQSSSCSNGLYEFPSIINTVGTPDQFSWHFGDGSGASSNQITDVNPPQLATYPGTVHLYAGSGTYNVALTTTDTNVCYTTVTKSITLNAVPNANFSASTTCEGDSMTFTPSITPAGAYTYTWDFNDGTSSNLENPKHLFANADTFSVMLKIGTGAGCSDSIVRNVIVNPKPNSSFTVNNVCLGNVTPITNTTTGAMFYTWNFGDGGLKSNLFTPNKTYGDTGNYTIQLIARSNKGCKDTVENQVAVFPNQTANFSFVAACGADSIVFTNSSTTFGTVGYEWNFGDGTTSTSLNPVKYYTNYGTYPVRLVVSSSTGCNDTITKSVKFLPAPSANFSQTGNCYGDSTIFTNLSSVDTGAITYNWAFGDGGFSVQTNPYRIYMVPNSYTVRLIATANGCKDTVEKQIFVNPRPTAYFSYKNNICSGEAASITNTSSISNGSLTYSWNFGDSSTDTVAQPIKNYTGFGSFPIYLLATSDSGCVSSITRTLTIKESPISDFTANNICEGGVTTFTNNSSISTGTINYNWFFGDFSSSVSANPTKIYSSAGTYNVSLVTQSNGCKDSLVKQVSVYANPDAQFSVAHSCGSVNLQLANNSTTNAGSTYSWTFSDGTNSTDSIPVKSFASAGNYTVKLFVTTSSGCIDSISKTVDYKAVPVADFSANTICEGNSTSFTNSSSISNGTLTYTWDFGDIQSSNAQSPTHTYTSANAYNVSLITNSNLGCSDTVTKSVTVKANPLVDIGNNVATCGNQYTLNAALAGATYSWSNGSTDSSITVSANGTYSVTVTTSNGCVATDNATVTLNSNVSPQLGNDTTYCGPATLNAGYPGSTYLWNDNSINQTLNITSGGTYHVKVTDVNGCIGYDTISVNINSIPTVSLGNDTTLCEGSALTIDAQNTGASYSWNNGSTNQTINPTTSGFYFVKVTNGSNCSNNDTIQVTFKTLPVKPFGNDTASCSAITLNALNNGASYSWSTGASTQSISVSSTNTYSVIITGANACIVSDTIVATISTPPVVNLGADITVCADSVPVLDAQNTGSTYLWNNNETTQTINPSVSGTYIVKVTAPGGCYSRDTVVVNFNSLPSVNLGNDTGACSQIIIGTAAGAGTYSWNTGANTNTINVNNSGVYWVEVTGANSCISRDSINVSITPNPTVNLGANQTVCEGTTVTLDAANAGSEYSWSNGDTTQTIHVTQAGTYTVVVTNANNCSGNGNVTVNFNIAPAKPFGADTSACETLVLDATSAGANTYSWNTGATTSSITVTTTNNYSVELTGANGCKTYDTLNVVINNKPLVNLGSDRDTCGGSGLILNAGNTGLTYLWNTGSTTQTINPTANGNYWVKVFSAPGCYGIDTVNVKMKDFPQIDLGGNVGGCTMVTLNALNIGSTYSWSNGATSQQINVTSDGTFIVKVTNAGGCSESDTVTVDIYGNPSVNFANNVAACNGDPVTLDAGNPGGIYSWSNGATSQTLNVTTPGYYSVTVIDTNSCSNTAGVVVSISSKPTMPFGNDITSCGSVTLNALNPNCTYSWNTGASTQSITATSSNNYSVMVTNSAGCFIKDTIGVTINALPLVNLGPDTAICAGNGVTLNAQNSGATYSWNTGATSQSINVINNGVYIVEVTAGSNCSAKDTVKLTIHQAPVVNLGSDKVLCKNSELSLNAGNAGSTYIWGSNTSFVSTSQIALVTDSGKYWVSVTSANGCVASDTINILPSTNAVQAQFLVASQAYVGDTIYFVNLTAPEPATYNWDFKDGFTNDSVYNPSHVYGAANLYPVSLTVSKDECSSVKIKEVNLLPKRLASPKDSLVAFNRGAIQSAKLYPNPTNDKFSLEVLLSSTEELSIQIFDISGKLLYRKSTITKEYKEEFFVDEFVPGIYIVRAVTNEDVEVFKLIRKQ